MDPTKLLIRIDSSFSTPPTGVQLSPTKIAKIVKDESFSWNNLKLPIPKIDPEIQVSGSDVVPVDATIVDIKEYQKMITTKNNFSKLDRETFTTARNSTNPYENIGKAEFMNRAGVKIANTDGILNFSGFVDSYSNSPSILNRPVLKTSFDEQKTYCDLAGAPGAFTEYLQKRYPKSRGYGISLRSTDPSFKWDYGISGKYIDMETFYIIWGDPKYQGDNTGNLYTNSVAFASEVLAKEPTKIDLVVSDGGISVTGREEKQEILSTRLILTEILVALLVLKKGGNFICKLFDTVTKPMYHLIYICSLMFEQTWVFKPISSRPANSERYLTCKGFRGSDVARDAIILLNTVNNAYNQPNIKDVYLFGILKNVHPVFQKWFKMQNDRSIKRQKEMAENIIHWVNVKMAVPRNLVFTKSNIKYPNPEASRPVDLVKAYLLWNILSQ